MSAASRGAGDFLAGMATASHRRLDRAMNGCSEKTLRERIALRASAPAPRFDRAAFHLIAEIKRRSPSAGELAGVSLSAAEQARRYAEGGASVVSVLTEPAEFGGDLAHLAEVARALPGLAVMRKDFLVGTYQILEARDAGAAGVLLIAGMLEPEQIEAMISCALDLGMFVLVEVFQRADLDRCVPALLARSGTPAGSGRVLLGVNCRDLRSLKVDFGHFARLAPHLPASLPWVAESGIETPADVTRVARLGYPIVLVGTALMRAGDPAAAAREMLGAGRAAMAAERG